VAPPVNTRAVVGFATASVIVGAASGVFAQFGPSLFTISSDFFHGQRHFKGNCRRIRIGYAIGTVVTVAMGWGGSVITGTAIPFLAAVGYSGLSIVADEWAIANPAEDDE
jgi:hypothetical protein